MKTFKYSLLSVALATFGQYTTTALAGDNIKWSGFLNAVANLSDNEATYLERVNDNGYFGNTAMGLNATARVDSNLTLAAQIIGGAHAGDGIGLDWAFANYRLNDATVLKFGKIKYAGNLYSETIDVGGFTYLWIHAPEAIYSEPTSLTFEAYRGAAIRYTPDANKMVAIELFTGSAEGNPVELRPKHVKMIGAVVSAENDMGRLQAAYTTSTMDLLDATGTPTPVHGEIYSVMSIGGAGNINNIGVIFEYSKSDTDKNAMETTTNTGSYLAVSYKMGNYMPHLTVQNFESDDGVGTVIENNALTLGLNKQLSLNSILKLEVESIDPKNGGFFEVLDNTRPAFNDESVTVFNVALNYVF